MKRSRKFAKTASELLVAVVIIGVIIALLVPLVKFKGTKYQAATAKKYEFENAIANLQKAALNDPSMTPERACDAEALRDYFVSNADIKTIVHYSEKDKVFENVTQAVAVIVLMKQKHGENFNIFIAGKNEMIEYKNLNKQNKYVFKSSNCVIDKMKLQNLTFDDICDGYKGDVNLGLKKDFFSKNIGKNSLPLIRGVQLSKYAYITGDEYCSKDALSKNHTEMERIVFQEVANMGLRHRTKGTILKNVICGDSCNIIFSKDNKKYDNRYILALLNSNAVNYYFKFFNQTNHVPIGEIRKIPFPTATPEQQKPIIDLVDQILAAKKADSSADTSELERKIDALVYELYGLTEEEIKVVEEIV